MTNPLEIGVLKPGQETIEPKSIAVTSGIIYHNIMESTDLTEPKPQPPPTTPLDKNGHLPESSLAQSALDAPLSEKTKVMNQWYQIESPGVYSLTKLAPIKEESELLNSFIQIQSSEIDPAGAYYMDYFIFAYNQLKPQFKEGNTATLDEAVGLYRKYINLPVHREATGSLLALQTDIQLPNFGNIMGEIAETLPTSDQKGSFEKAIKDAQTIMLIRHIGKEKFHALEMEEFKSLLVKDENYNSYLKPGEKIIFHENRLPGEIPNLSEARMKELLGEEGDKMLSPLIYGIRDYLRDGQPIEDPFFDEIKKYNVNFHKVDGERKEALRKKYGEVVNRFFNLSQLRRNTITGVLDVIRVMHMAATFHGNNMQAANRLGEINDEARFKFHGPEGSHYEKIDNKERMDFVENYLKGAALEVLGMVAVIPKPTESFTPLKSEK